VPSWEFIPEYLTEKIKKGYTYTKSQLKKRYVKETGISEQAFYKALHKSVNKGRLLVQCNKRYKRFLVPKGLTLEDLTLIREQFLSIDPPLFVAWDP